MQKNTQIGWIGLGVMGGSMCQHLLAAAYSLSVFSRSRDKASAVLCWLKMHTGVLLLPRSPAKVMLYLPWLAQSRRSEMCIFQKTAYFPVT